MYNQAAQTYQRTSQTTANPRELEAGLLLKAARQLQALQDNWTDDKKALDSALTYNRRLWTIISTSATSKESPLPAAIKQNIANLSVFIFNHTVDTYATPAPERLTSLIQINCMIAEGLRGQA